MRAGLALLALTPIGIGAQIAANVPVPPTLPSEEALLNEKRKAIHRSSIEDKDSSGIPVPAIDPVKEDKNSALNATDVLGPKTAKPPVKKRSSWLWGGDEGDDNDKVESNDDKKGENGEGNQAAKGQTNANEAAAGVGSSDDHPAPIDGVKLPSLSGVKGEQPKSSDAKAKNSDEGEVQKDSVNDKEADEEDDKKDEDKKVDKKAGESEDEEEDEDEDDKGKDGGSEEKANSKNQFPGKPVTNDTLSDLDDEPSDPHFRVSLSAHNDTGGALNESSVHRWSSLFKRPGNKPELKAAPVGGNSTGVPSGPPTKGMQEEKRNEVMMAGAPANVQSISDGIEISLGDPGNPERWAVMQRAGLPSAQFKCGVSDSSRLFQVSSLQAVSSLLVSDDSLGGRVDLDDSEDDVWSLHRPFQLLGGNSRNDVDADSIIHLKNFTITAELVPPANTSSNGPNAAEVLQVYTSPLVEGGNLVVSSNDNVDIIYVCKTAGVARIKVQATGSGGSPYCFEWLKHCKPSWDGFQVLETGTGRTVSEDGRVTTGWQPASSGSTVSFMLTHPGSEGSIRMKGVSVSSNNPNLNVTLRGALDTIVNETSPVANIITIVADIAEQVDVIYSCADGHDEQADVLLKFYNEASSIPPLEIPWTAHCSGNTINDVSATMSSCRAKKLGSSLQQTQAMFKGDVADTLQSGSITIAADDDCTALLFSTESPDSIIELSPSHQLIYDRRMLMVANKIGTVETTITGDTLLRIPYICLDDGVSDVALTVYFKNKSSADFHWKKACQKPGVHTSAMLTGRHIFGIIMALFLSSFLLCFISRSRTLTQFILMKLGNCCPWCCRRRQSSSSDERTQFTAFGVAV